MRILVMGADGYLGWPTVMHLAQRGHRVLAVDSYLKRLLVRETGGASLIPTHRLGPRALAFQEAADLNIGVKVGECTDVDFLRKVLKEFKPDAVVHYAEQPSGPYSMIGYEEAETTLGNNLGTTLALIWAVMEEAPGCHIVKLGTAGEYGNPNIDIEEGWIDIEHKGRSDRFLFPRQAGSLYHTCKILETDLLWFYCRMRGLRVTDLMQGPVYGMETEEMELGDGLETQFHYDAIFGTVLNRFLVQAVLGMPLTVYGEGGQTRGYLNIRDTLQCVELAVESPVDAGELRIFNQMTETFSVNQLAARVAAVGNDMGLGVSVQHVKNPRIEAEDHYYNPVYTGLVELGLEPHFLTEDVMAGMLETVLRYRDRIQPEVIMPRVQWDPTTREGM